MDSMESSTIALIVRYFNITTTTTSAFFAIYGLIIVIFGVNSRWNVFRGKMFWSAFCVASLLAFAVETVFFNYRHYLKYFADEEFSVTMVSSQEPISSDSSIVTEIRPYQNDDNVFATSVIIRGINRKVTSVFIKPTLNNRETLEVYVRWSDESDVREGVRDFKRTLYKVLPHENHIAVQCVGNVSELEVLFPGRLLYEELSQIVVNSRIPLYFSGLRLFVVSMLFFAIILFVYKPLRAKTAYYLFEYKFDPVNKKQNIVYVGLVILILSFSWFCDYTTKVGGWLYEPANLQYNRYLVDAFLLGKTNIDYGHPENLLNVERPYNAIWLILNGYWSNVNTYDISYYKGKFYTYYGPIPVILCYLPYKFITGTYMSHHAGVFVFTAIAVIFLALLWRFLVKKYMPDARFAFVLLSFLTLFFVSFLVTALRLPCYGSVPQAAGLAFYVAGAFLLLKSADKEKINHLQLFFACLCFALTVGCRPNMVLLSILVPAVLWRRRSWKLALFILIPYVMVAIPICFYNYTRFESIFEFGQRYCIENSDFTARHLLNPLGKIHRMFIVFTHYLFRLYNYSLNFPFVGLLSSGDLITRAYGFILICNNGGGLINFPILYCLLYLFKNIFSKDKPRGFYLSSVFFITAVVMILACSWIGTFHERYLMDCAVFLVLSSLFCAYYWCQEARYHVENGNSGTIRLKIIYVLLTISIFVGLFRFVTGSDHAERPCQDPVLYRYLEYSLGTIERF